MVAAFGTLALASCVSADRGDTSDPSDDTADTGDTAPYAPVCSGGRFTCKSYVHVDGNNRIKAHATVSGLGPTQLTSAYKLSASKTSTATIAIVDAFHYPNAESDLATYRSQFGLPPCTKANGCFQVLNKDGNTSPLPGNAPAGDDWTVEAALDLDLASAACPTCKLILFEATSDQDLSLFEAQNGAAKTPGVVAISNSWGGPSDGNDASYDSTYFTHTQAINTFIATGDSGYTGNSPDYPSTSLKVIGVGGTTLRTASNTRGWTETAWSGAGSSCSKLLAKPSYQSGISTSICGKRAASDVSAVANPSTGLAVFNAGSGGWIVVGGTSASSPFVAGVWARYGLASPHDASYPYGHTTEFFDVTSGSNGSCTTALCKSAAGWDGPTGVGSPDGSKLGGGGGTCTPSCSGKTCGPDGCGGTCGTCGSGQTCSSAGTCVTTSCAHSECTTGTKLTSGCDACVTSICAADSFCCSSSWDSICVGEVASVCNQTCN